MCPSITALYFSVDKSAYHRWVERLRGSLAENAHGEGQASKDSW